MLDLKSDDDGVRRSAWQALCEGPGAFSPENQKESSAARVQRKCWGSRGQDGWQERGGKDLAGPVDQIEVFAIHSQCSEERLTLTLSAQERQHQRSTRYSSALESIESRERGGENGCRKLTAGIQEEPKGWDPPPGPGGSPREREAQGCAGSPLQPMQRGGSLTHSATRFSWKKSNRSAHPRREPYRIRPEQQHEGCRHGRAAALGPPPGLNGIPTLPTAAPRNQVTHPTWDCMRKVNRDHLRSQPWA